jgi:hypothetical protein
LHATRDREMSIGEHKEIEYGTAADETMRSPRGSSKSREINDKHDTNIDQTSDSSKIAVRCTNSNLIVSLNRSNLRRKSLEANFETE